jgi:hypothetical protein
MEKEASPKNKNWVEMMPVLENSPMVTSRKKRVRREENKIKILL